MYKEKNNEVMKKSRSDLAGTAFDDDVTTFTDVTSLLGVGLGCSRFARLEVVLFVRHVSAIQEKGDDREKGLEKKMRLIKT